MYKKNLTEKMNFRLSASQLEFLCCLADARNCSSSDVLRDILNFYILEWERSAFDDRETSFNSKL